MKYILPAFLLLASFSAFADPSFPEISRSEQKDISDEFGVNFSHTTVSGPETNGLWGLEVGVIGSKTNSPTLSRVIERETDDGEDYKELYGAGIMARAHFPLDLFVEGTILPSQDFDDINVRSHSFSVGWNFGGFFDWPVDVALGANYSQADFRFNQTIQNESTLFAPVDGDIRLNSKIKTYYIGVSKKILFFTPYFKYGIAQNDARTRVNAEYGDIFTYSGNQSEKTTTHGSYLVAGANFQLFIFKIGGEYTKMLDVDRVSAKVSLDF